MHIDVYILNEIEFWDYISLKNIDIYIWDVFQNKF